MPIDPKFDVHVFYGPSDKFFDAYNLASLPSHITLLQLASKIDRARFSVDSQPLHFEEEALVIWPEEFFGVKDNFTHSLWRNLLETNIRKVYIANPPKLLVDQAKLLQCNVEEKAFDYAKVNLGLVTEAVDQLNQQIVGQDRAITTLSRSLISLLNTESKPVVIMLYGPTGVGKTESAKIIAKAFKGEAKRLQFSMLQTNSLAEYLYGSKINSRSFAADLLERRSNVVIFDEFDKTGSAFHSAFYQLFDEGVFVDKNYSVDMSNTLIVCTSNYATPQEIRKHLGAPLSSRFSAFVKYDPLSRLAKEQIIERKIDTLYASYPENLRQTIDTDLVKKNYMNILCQADNVREISNNIEYILSDFILKFAKDDRD